LSGRRLPESEYSRKFVGGGKTEMLKYFFVVLLFAAACVAQTIDMSSAEADAQNENKLEAERAVKNPGAHFSQPAKIAKIVRTVYVWSDTFLIERDDLIERLRTAEGFNDLDLVLVEDSRKADMELVAQHIPFTFDYTLKAIDIKTTATLATARVTVFNGYLASIELPKKFVTMLREQRAAGQNNAR
jgi:hypothetical protein